MNKRDPKEWNSFFDEEGGTSQVTQQIMNSYNSGFVGEQEQNESDNEKQNV